MIILRLLMNILCSVRPSDTITSGIYKFRELWQFHHERRVLRAESSRLSAKNIPLRMLSYVYPTAARGMSAC